MSELRENTCCGVVALMGLWLDARIRAFDVEDGQLSSAVSSVNFKVAKMTLVDMVREAGLNPDDIFIEKEIADKITAPSSTG